MIHKYPYIIGEAGSCHEGSLKNALELVGVAKDAGCNAVKFQYWSSPTRMCERRHVTGAYEQGSVKESWLPLIRDEAHSCKLDFICSVYLPEDIPTLAPHVDGWKISSFEAGDEDLVGLVTLAAYQHSRLFISTGMGYIGTLPTLATLLHCVSAYPCPVDQANLGAIYGAHDGYSDHTRCVLTGGFAVSAGADYLEVHFRLDETSETCPDHCVSLTPNELRQYVVMAHTAMQMRGSGVKVVQEAEKENLAYRVVV